MSRQKRAFTLVELILTVLFIGIFAFIAVPKLNFAALYRQQADTVARKIITDLRRTRSLAISNAADNTAGFRLQMNGSTTYSSYRIVDANSGSVEDSHTIDSSINCAGGSTFEFGYLGNLKTGSDTQLTVSASGKTFTITIIPATGTVKCTESES